MIKHLLSFLFVVSIVIFPSSLVQSKDLDKLIKSYDLITDKIIYDKEKDIIKATTEIQTNEQILIIPVTKVISSVEPYQFEEFFSKNQKEKLIGRLLIEKFIGQNSTQYNFIESLPSSTELTDYYHFSEDDQKEFIKRVYHSSNSFENRKEQYESLIKKIPSNPMSQALLNWDLYNWASSIVNCYAVVFKKYYYYGEVRRISKFQPSKNTKNINDELCLVPGLNAFKKGKFTNMLGNKLESNIFVYKNNIYLNSDRFIDEDNEVFNEIEFQTNTELFEQCGTFVEDYYHEEIKITLPKNDWSINKYNLCKELDCFGGNSSPEFSFKSNLNLYFLLYCQIDQTSSNEKDLKFAYKQLKNERKISKNNYLQAAAKGIDILKDFAKKNQKTKLIQDIMDLEKIEMLHLIKNNILKYAISQKMILLNQIQLLNDKIINEMKEDIFGGIKNKYIK